MDVYYIKKPKAAPTGVAVITVSGGNNRIILDKGANACLETEDIDEFLLSARPGDIYLTQLENPIETIGYGLKKAKEIGMYTILNPAPANVDIARYFAYVDLITPNETECEIFGGKENLFKKGIKTVINHHQRITQILFTLFTAG